MPAGPAPKDRFTALDTLAVCRELRTLERGRVDKAFDRDGGGWSIAFRVPGEGRRELVLVPGRFAALVGRGLEHPEVLSPLARELRRLLTGASLRTVHEPGGERYLELEFARGDDPEPMTLALEMFGKGNLVIAHGGKIVAVAEARRWAHRSVRVGADYTRPPTRVDPLTVTAAVVSEVLAGSRTDLASTLAARLALGGPVAEELIARCGWSGATPASSAPVESGSRLVEAIHTLVREIGDRPSGHLYLLDGVPVDASPFPSHRWATIPGVELRATASFSEAALEYFGSLVPKAPDPATVAANSRRAEVERQVAQQRAAVEELAAAVESRKRDAEAILDAYGTVEAALTDARRADPKVRRLTLALDGRSIEVDAGRSPRAAAQAIFEDAKRLALKLEGARAALDDTLARRPTDDPAAVSTARPTATPRSRTFWFEKFRWFISSEGVVVVAGRDAPSNDVIVRRNLKAGDVYLHADLQGAASVIVKRPASGPIGPATLEEAAQWAVSYSKAWRAGLASANAFWVNPDQVSKSAASGEFVARGAWVIHGTKNFLRDRPLELALGTILYEGEERWTVAPERAVRARGTVRFLLTPGPERDRAEVERSIGADLGLSRSVLQALFPAGGIMFRRA